MNGKLLRVGFCCAFIAACGNDSKDGTTASGNMPPCADVCTDVIAAQCPSGPSTQQDCVSGCETIRAGKCKTQYQALFECAGSNPSYTCDANGFVQVVGCESADNALNSCLATP